MTERNNKRNAPLFRSEEAQGSLRNEIPSWVYFFSTKFGRTHRGTTTPPMCPLSVIHGLNNGDVSTFNGIFGVTMIFLVFLK